VRRKRLLTALVCLQVAIPFWATTQGVPHMFGFHMFTGYEPLSVVVRDADQARVDVNLSDWITVRREDVDWSRRLGSAICADVAEATTVTVSQWGAEKVHTC
jgi:hypothetical protein